MFHVTKVKTLDFHDLQDYVNEHSYEVSRTSLDDGGWSLSGGDEEAILAKIKAAGVPLGEYVKGKIYYGIKTGLNEAFVIDSETRDRLITEDPKSEELIKPFLVGRDVKRYCITDEGRYLILIPKGWTRQKSGNVSDTWKWFKQTYPAIANYLMSFKDRAEKRYDQGESWWELRACDYYKEFEEPKIIYAEIATKGQFTLDSDRYFSDTTTYILGNDSKYFLGILNSKLWTFLFSKTSSEIRGGFFRWKRQYMLPLPIRTIDFNNPKDKALHENMVSLVDRMLELQKKLQSARIAHDRELLERQIKITDDQIDRLVYELYGLTEEERRIVEGG